MCVVSRCAPVRCRSLVGKLRAAQESRLVLRSGIYTPGYEGFEARVSRSFWRVIGCVFFWGTLFGRVLKGNQIQSGPQSGLLRSLFSGVSGHPSCQFQKWLVINPWKISRVHVHVNGPTTCGSYRAVYSSEKWVVSFWLWRDIVVVPPRSSFGGKTGYAG